MVTRWMNESKAVLVYFSEYFDVFGLFWLNRFGNQWSGLFIPPFHSNQVSTLVSVHYLPDKNLRWLFWPQDKIKLISLQSKDLQNLASPNLFNQVYH